MQKLAKYTVGHFNFWLSLSLSECSAIRWAKP